MSGGIVLKHKNQFLIEPTCCGDIGNIYEWLNIIEEEKKNWSQLWIGHPWVFYKKDKDLILFSQYYEKNIEEIKDIKISFQTDCKNLKSQLKVLLKEHLLFENKIQRLLSEIGIKNAAQIAKLLTGNK